MQDIYQEIVRILAEDKEAAVVTIISASHSTPRGVGAKMLVRADGSIVGTIGGGKAELESIKESLNVMATGRPKRLYFNLVPRAGGEGMICGGEMEVFIEPVLQAPTMFLFGGGHISLALAKIGKLVGFKIAVIDNRAEFANRERFPEADQVIGDDYVRSFSQLKIDKSSYIVIITQGHKSDEAVLGLALGTPAKYIGMIGSKTKVKTVSANLLAKGITQEQLNSVHSPIGLETNAETPEEIAVSIMAEIIKVCRSPQS